MLVTVIVLSVALCLASVGWLVADLRRRRARREVERLRRALERQSSLMTHRPAARAVRAMVGSALEAAVKVRNEGLGVVVKDSLEGLARWSQEDETVLARLAGADGRVAIAFSDIEDSTVLNDQLGDAEWVKLLASHDRLVRSAVAARGGHIVKSQGDGFMIAFADAGEAVRGALDLRAAIEAGDRRLRKRPIHVRVGVHIGTAIERDGDLFGRDVALAARVAAEAVGGEILVSDAVHDAVADDADLQLVEAQTVELKGLPGAHRLWSVAGG
ncbi:MAG TPA: adenylate/guanylate cyclase domain-containing protein [Aeromicrobium sp.]|nr:adenylate/guanylate cyclase domain-containing protein [Aeromicrobium sp.]HKY56694.1 adenylate/guanylate cyclase domain-containing protein [Aeromicrobium sp.]